MSNGDDSSTRDDSHGDDGRNSQSDSRDADTEYIDGVDEDAVVETDPETLSLTPAQYEQLKDRLHGEALDEVKYHERRYLVIGRGDGAAGKRRRTVRDLLDGRREATAFRLEDFGLTGEDLDLWVPAFEVLCEQATHVVGVLEDYDGGHVWELGYLYHQQSRLRDVLWLLKRVYESEARQREQYDNGMAASHLAAVEAAAGERVVEWADDAELENAVGEIP